MVAQGEAFTHSSVPHPVSSSKTRNKPKYRDEGLGEEDEINLSNNIMYDRRVVRGNTYAAQVVTQNAQREAEQLRIEHERQVRRKAAMRKKLSSQIAKPNTPPAVFGRVHMDVQTDDYLEELSDRPIELDAETQTQAFLDRPPSPLFVPAKSGVDVWTQIEANDLFDFDLEVTPLLEVLVGKTLEVSMLELMEEEELAEIKKRQEDFQQRRNAELIEVQRLEAEAKRKMEEKQRRFDQEKQRKEERSMLREKIAARSFATSYLSGMYTDVFDDLENEGEFYDPITKQVEENFLPWLTNIVQTNLNQVLTSKMVMESILESSLEKAVTTQKVKYEEYLVEKAKKEAEEAKRLAEEEEARLAALQAQNAENADDDA